MNTWSWDNGCTTLLIQNRYSYRYRSDLLLRRTALSDLLCFAVDFEILRHFQQCFLNGVSQPAMTSCYHRHIIVSENKHDDDADDDYIPLSYFISKLQCRSTFIETNCFRALLFSRCTFLCYLNIKYYFLTIYLRSELNLLIDSFFRQF